MKVLFNKPLITGNENKYINDVISGGVFSGNNEYSKKCNRLIEDITGCGKAIVTSSCTDALEMTALLANIEPGDEVIMPSYTFVTTASAFALRKAGIVWCDIRPDTKNIDEDRIEELITEKTKALVIVHYAGVACEMDKITEICNKHGIILIEDAAQAIGAEYKGKPLGSFGDMAALSFHETKNIQCGEGGALLVNNEKFFQRAEFIRDKGTDRTLFNKGQVDKYTWVELGSSFLMSELQAAFLYAQLIEEKHINEKRKYLWEEYYQTLKGVLKESRLPAVTKNSKHNGHIFYIMTDSFEQRKELITFLNNSGISAIFHYIPLHKAPYWKGKYDNFELPVTNKVSETLLRLPMHYGLYSDEVKYICNKLKDFLNK